MIIDQTKQHFKKEWRTYLGMLVVASSIGFSAQASKANAPTADQPALLQVSGATDSIWVTVINEGKPEWVEVQLDELTPSPSPDSGFPTAATVSPTPIVPFETAAPGGSPTPTQVTPAAPTVTMIPLPDCEDYPCFYPADRILQVVRAVTLRDGASTGATAIRVRDVGEKLYVQCIKEVSKGGSQWASEFTCDAPFKTWTAVIHNGIQYLQLFTKE